MKSQFPYLVDLSLTNQCPLINMCSVGDKCYASPVHKTQELTSWNYFQKVVKAMFDNNVLEIAIGGYSEPTTAMLYSDYSIRQLQQNSVVEDCRISKYDFSEVCAELKKYYFNVGWTTRNYNLHQLPFLSRLLEHTDSIAFSATTMEDLQKVSQCIMSVNNMGLDRGISRYGNNAVPTAQIILEVVSFEEFKQFVTECTKTCYLPITILGYKDFGNGKDKKPYQYSSKWIDFMQSLDLYDGFGVDSQIVKDWGDELKSRGVENYRLVAKEGSQTCFIDLQKRVMKPSSFTNASFDLSDPETQFSSTFHKF